jgi:hypothetical protein
VGRSSSTRRTIRRISSARRRSHRTAPASIHRWPSRGAARAWSIGISRGRASRGKVPVVVLLSIALVIITVISLTVVILVLVVLLVVLLWCRRRSVLALRWRPWCSWPVECTRGGVSPVVSHLCVCLFLCYSRELSVSRRVDGRSGAPDFSRSDPRPLSDSTLDASGMSQAYYFHETRCWLGKTKVDTSNSCGERKRQTGHSAVGRGRSARGCRRLQVASLAQGGFGGGSVVSATSQTDGPGAQVSDCCGLGWSCLV